MSYTGHSGYDQRFVHPLLKRHECPICLLAMRDPVQTECGHLFCRECLEPVLSKETPLCPMDNAPLSKDEVKFPLFDWLQMSGVLDPHRSFLTMLAEEKFSLWRQCGLNIPVQSLTAHQEEECPMRIALCEYCGKSIPLEQTEDHLQQVCVEYVHQCPNKCDPNLELKLPQLEAHLDPKTGDCPLAEVPCPLEPFGCTFVSSRKNIPAHLDQAKMSHASLQADSWAQLNDIVASNSMAIEHISNRFSGLESSLHSVQELQHALEERLEAMDLRVRDRLADTNFSIQLQIEALQAKLIELKRRMDNDTTGEGMKPYSSKLAAKATTGESAGQRLDITLQTKVAELDHGLDRCLSSCLDQELRLQLLERATYNGVLLWKIDDFARRRKEAVDGLTMSLYSIPFYTSRHGYKMCARVYLNGDGMGKGTHLSFFFVVMKGPFDALLPWPFKQKVTLTIINQTEKKHVTDTFHPDPQSNSFHRPAQKEMNVASGCPVFIRHEQLLNGGFVKDDCIFLRVVVDVTDIATLT
eukprot:Em0885g1a